MIRMNIPIDRIAHYCRQVSLTRLYESGTLVNDIKIMENVLVESTGGEHAFGSSSHSPCLNLSCLANGLTMTTT